MLKTVDAKNSRVVEIRRPVESQPDLELKPAGQRSLKGVLAGLRAEMDGLAVRLARERGLASQPTVRAEQISHAIQRLEWALEREDGYPSAS